MAFIYRPLRKQRSNSVELQAGDRFETHFVTSNPLEFTVISVDRDNNSLVVDVLTKDGYSHRETWDDLDTTEMAFEIGEYNLILD